LINPVTQDTVISPGIVFVLLPWEFPAVRETVNFPFLVYVCTGFLVVKEVPSPKFQLHEVGDPVLQSVNCIFNGAFPDVGDAENAPTGVLRGATTFI
jgi:hypothetical protein